VQDEVERALEVMLRRPVKVTVAGRTDAGVHAWGQVASYDGEPVPVRSLNALLPDDVAVLFCEEGPAGFDARFNAISRTYCYRIWTGSARPALLRRRVWHWAWPCDRPLLDECAAAITGKHDFRAFTLSDQLYESYRRTVIRSQWIDRPGGVLEYWIEGDSFTRRMVRSLVAYQLEIVRGLHGLDDLGRLLEGAPRVEGGGTAPAEGLFLAAVGYDPPVASMPEFGEARC
jgi:tRNA pseudouridine38-40 synthase